MLSLDINHPNANKFIDKKLDTTKVTGANISVKIDDAFMFNKDHYPKQGELWNKIVHNSWKSAEPGILFWDTILRESPTRGYDIRWRESSTNPCGEIPLCPYDSCRLLAINLYSYVENPFTDKAKFNFILFSKHVRYAQRLMDDIVDLEIEKLDKIIAKIESDPESEDIKQVELNLWRNIRQMAIDGRRTGLGVTAEGDMLAALGLIYGTKEATEFSERVHKQLAICAYHSTIMLAKERGSFPIWDATNDVQSDFIDRLFGNIDNKLYNDFLEYGRRNIALLTIAPTGTTSLMTQTTSGIEPVFLPVYKRRRKTQDPSKSIFKDEVGDMWEEYSILHPKFKIWYNLLGYDIPFDEHSEESQNIILKASPYYKATSADIDYMEKVRMQGAIQKWVDHSISVTINMHKDVTEQEVEDVLIEAWKSGCKGVTIYRDGCRSGVLVSNNAINTKFEQHHAPKRPKTLVGHFRTVKVNGGDYFVIIGLLEGKPYEIFASKNNWNIKSNLDCTITKKSRGRYEVDIPEYLKEDIIEEMSDEEETITRLVSTSLRHGADIKFIVEQLNKTKGDLTRYGKALARILKKYLNDGEKVSGAACPECNSENLVYQDGCLKCSSCGYSKCG